MKAHRLPFWASVVCLIPLLGWWLYGLFDLDEGFYAAVVAEMNRRGEWITPYFNGHPWFEKPVLLYWIAKPCYALFGGEFGIRLPSVLASLATYAIIAWFGKRRLGPNSGIIAALVLATSLFFVAVGRMVLVDPLLITCLTGTFVTFWESLVGDKRWRLATAALLGAAVLAKGPVSLVLFISVAGYTFWREKELRPAFKGWWPLGFLILAAVIAAWYVPAYLENGHLFVQKFLVEQNLQRFKGGDEAHAVPMPVGLIYYIPVLLIGMIPWSLFIPRAWPRKNDEGEDAPVRRYLATWAVVIFAFFTISGTKLPHYVLPCFPPLALLVGHDLATRWQGLSWRRIAGPATGAVSLGVFLTFGFVRYYQAVNAGPKRFAAPLVQDFKHSDSAGFYPREFAMFRLGKQPAGLYPDAPKGKILGTDIRINETSLPSILFYLQPLFSSNGPSNVYNGGPPISPLFPDEVIDTDDLQDLLAQRPLFVLTRPGRLTTAERESLMSRGIRVSERPEMSSALTTCYEFLARPGMKP